MTALDTIFEAQRGLLTGKIRDYIAFEAVDWACVMAAAFLGHELE